MRYSRSSEGGGDDELTAETSLVVSDIAAESPAPSPVDKVPRSSKHVSAAKPRQARKKLQGATATPRRSQRSRQNQVSNTQNNAVGAKKPKVVKRPRRKKQNGTSASASAREWVVEKILDAGIDSETLEHSYLVKWEGCDKKESTWEPKRNLAGCLDAIRRFEESRPTYKTK